MSLFYIHFHKTVMQSSGGSRWSTEQSTQWCHSSDWACVFVCVWKLYAMALEPLSPRWKIFSSFLGPLSYSSKTHTHTHEKTSRLCSAFVLCLDLIVCLADAIIQHGRNSFFFFFFLCVTQLFVVSLMYENLKTYVCCTVFAKAMLTPSICLIHIWHFCSCDGCGKYQSSS